MKELTNVGAIGVSRNKDTANVILQYSDGTVETKIFEQGDEIVVNGVSVGQVVSITSDTVTFLSYKDGNTLVSEVGDIGNDQTAQEIISSIPDDAVVVPPGSINDSSGRRDTVEPLDFSGIIVPKRRDGSDLKQVDFLDLNKAEPLRDELTEKEEKEETFKPQKYRVAEINKTDSGIATATIYNYSNNITVGNYRVGQAIPEFENRTVKEIDTDPESKTYRNVTLNDGTIILYEPKSDTETYKRNLEESLDEINATEEERAKVNEAIASNPAPPGTYWVPLREDDGGIILVANDYAKNPDGTYYRAGYDAVAEYANDNGYEIPDKKTIDFIDSNADKTVDFYAAGVPDTGNRKELIEKSDEYLEKNLSVGVSEITTGHMKNTIILDSGQVGIYLDSINQNPSTGGHNNTYYDYSHGYRAILRIP